MSVQIKVPTTWRAFTGGERKFDIPSSATVGEALNHFFELFPVAQLRLLDDDSQLQRHINIGLGYDGSQSEILDRASALTVAIVVEPAYLDIIPSVAGGSE